MACSAPAVPSWLCAELRVLRKRVNEMNTIVRPRQLCLDELITATLPARPPGDFSLVFDSEDVPISFDKHTDVSDNDSTGAPHGLFLHAVVADTFDKDSSVFADTFDEESNYSPL